MSEQIKGNVDVLMIWDTKVDDSFPIGNFLINGFDIHSVQIVALKVRRIILMVREDISSKYTNIQICKYPKIYNYINIFFKFDLLYFIQSIYNRK